jgi:hypothetical protein
VAFWLILIGAAFVSSIVWLARNWGARGPTDLWKDEDIIPKESPRADVARAPDRPDPHAGQLIEVGYWTTGWDPDRPNPGSFVDPDWSHEERQEVLGHLRAGIALPWEQGPVEFCSFCGSVLVVQELTDGTYVWPTGLIHYVDAHAIRLPGLFVLHVKRSPALEVSRQAGSFVEGQRRDSEWWNALSGP